MILRACAVCAKPTPNPYCEDHKPKPWAGSTRSERVGLSGGAEQARAKRILDQYLHCCHVCGKTGADQVDHVVPLAEGGPDDESNLAPIHKEPCHRQKTAEEARRGKKRKRGWAVPPTATGQRSAKVGRGALAEPSGGEL